MRVGLSYRSIAACFVALIVPGATSAAEPETKAQAQAAPAAPQAPAAPSVSSSSKATSAPTLETPPQPPPAAMPPEHGTKPASKAPATPIKKVDLNNASLAELKTLPTVGDAEAKKIIAHRPYKSKGELVTKAGLPEGVYQAVRHKVELQTPRQVAPKK